MKHTLGCLCAFFAVTGAANAQEVHFVQQDVRVPPHLLTRVERALTWQSRQLTQVWHTPSVEFTRDGGWPIVLVSPRDWKVSAFGYHGSGSMYVEWGPVLQIAEDTLSHELVEQLVDPTDLLNEVADPVCSSSYGHDGVILSDFVTPAWFVPGSQGPWDLLHVTKGPLDSTFD